MDAITPRINSPLFQDRISLPSSIDPENKSSSKTQREPLSSAAPTPITSFVTLENESQTFGEKVLDIIFRPKPNENNSVTTLTPTVSDTGEISVETKDGYTVKLSGNNQEVIVEFPDGSSKTRFWGDPHVEESDGDSWDFKNDSSFVFGENKITFETTPAWNDTTYIGTVHLYHGEDRISIEGIDKDKPEIITWSLDASTQDPSVADGDSFSLTAGQENRFSWDKNK